MSQVFPQAVIADKYIFLSGTPGYDSGHVVSDDFEEQSRQCFLNIKIIMESRKQFEQGYKGNCFYGNRKWL